MRKLASVQRIYKIEPIEGADRIELAHVLGWQCVVPKGQFTEMDLCVYFEIDSFLPVAPEFEFLRQSYKKNDLRNQAGILGYLLPSSSPTKYSSVDDLLKRADGKYPNGGPQEGIVIRPTTPVYSDLLGADLSMKVINNKYLGE